MKMGKGDLIPVSDAEFCLNTNFRNVHNLSGSKYIWHYRLRLKILNFSKYPCPLRHCFLSESLQLHKCGNLDSLKEKNTSCQKTGHG